MRESLSSQTNANTLTVAAVCLSLTCVCSSVHRGWSAAKLTINNNIILHDIQLLPGREIEVSDKSGDKVKFKILALQYKVL